MLHILNLFAVLGLAILCEMHVNKPLKAKMEQSTAANAYIMCVVLKILKFIFVPCWAKMKKHIW